MPLVGAEPPGGETVLKIVEEKKAWNGAVKRLGGSVLQSWEWGEFRSRHGWRPLRLLSPAGDAAAQVLLRDLPLPGLGSLAYVPHGPVCMDEARLPATVEEVALRIRERGAAVIRVEPRVEENDALQLKGFARSASTVQPRCTRIVEILGDEEAQLKALPKDTRYGVRRARREGVVAAASGRPEDLEAFLDLLAATASRQRFALRPREYYREFMRDLPAHLVVARRDGEEKLLAGAAILTFGEEAYYLYGASAKEGDNLYASYLTQFEVMNLARRHEARRYDMWGPCRPAEGDPLWGVYQFKKKFGGEEKRYVGAHEKDLAPFRGRLARLGIAGYYSIQRLRGKSSGPIAD
ncbi:MAG: peptidoglycan bridge formation glycyltransferase FemA/FemB family protein [Actinomycetota bacterium]